MRHEIEQRADALAAERSLRFVAQSRLGAVLRADPLLVRVERTDEVHVRLDVPRRLEGRADPERPRRTVDEAQTARQAGLLGDPVEAGLPVITLATRAFRGDRQEEVLSALGLLEQRADRSTRVLAIERNAPGLPQHPSHD